jgi:hypothetical protein
MNAAAATQIYGDDGEDDVAVAEARAAAEMPTQPMDIHVGAAAATNTSSTATTRNAPVTTTGVDSPLNTSFDREWTDPRRQTAATSTSNSGAAAKPTAEVDLLDEILGPRPPRNTSTAANRDGSGIAAGGDDDDHSSSEQDELDIVMKQEQQRALQQQQQRASAASKPTVAPPKAPAAEPVIDNPSSPVVAADTTSASTSTEPPKTSPSTSASKKKGSAKRTARRRARSPSPNSDSYHDDDDDNGDSDDGKDANGTTGSGAEANNNNNTSAAAASIDEDEYDSDEYLDTRRSARRRKSTGKAAGTGARTKSQTSSSSTAAAAAPSSVNPVEDAETFRDAIRRRRSSTTSLQTQQPSLTPANTNEGAGRGDDAMDVDVVPDPHAPPPNAPQQEHPQPAPTEVMSNANAAAPDHAEPLPEQPTARTRGGRGKRGGRVAKATEAVAPATEPAAQHDAVDGNHSASSSLDASIPTAAVAVSTPPVVADDAPNDANQKKRKRQSSASSTTSSSPAPAEQSTQVRPQRGGRGSRTPSGSQEAPPPEANAPAVDARADADEAAVAVPEPSPSKRTKHAEKPHVMFTKIPADKLTKLQDAVAQLGGVVVLNEADYKSTTHLIADSIQRTEKFLAGVNVTRYVVTSAWVEACLTKKAWVPEQPYLLKDAAAERQHGFNLKETLQRAQEAKVFYGLKFYLTPGIDSTEKHLSIKQLQTIITCAGGGFVQMPPKTPHDSIIVISCPKDEVTYKALAVSGIVSHSAEFVMMGVLRQRVDRVSFRLGTVSGTGGADATTVAASSPSSSPPSRAFRARRTTGAQ